MIGRLVAFVDRARVFFLPLAMAALLAVGAHTAADALGDLFLEWIDRAQGLFDSIVSRWSVTAPLVDLIGLTRRTQLSRLAALAFEIIGDVLLALPMLVFEERPGLVARAQAVLARAARRPTLIVFARSIFAASLALAGAAAIARMVDGAVTLELRGLFGSLAASLGRALGFLALVWLGGAIASRATLRALEQAELKSQRALETRARFLFGLTGSVLLAPLAMIALARALPLGSFFR